MYGKSISVRLLKEQNFEEAADDLELNEDDVKNIFVENALRLFNIKI